MSAYAISLFLHIVGAIGLGATLGLEWASLHHLRRAGFAAQVREWSRLLEAPRLLGGPAAVTVLITGLHLSSTRWGPQPWIVVGLAGMVLIAVLGGALSGRRTSLIVRAVPAEEGPISVAFGQRLQDPVLAASLRIRTALFLGIVCLMSTKPSAVGALSVMGVALVIGLVAALAPRGGARRPAGVGSTAR